MKLNFLKKVNLQIMKDSLNHLSNLELYTRYSALNIKTSEEITSEQIILLNSYIAELDKRNIKYC